jgi:hypothetical protein
MLNPTKVQLKLDFDYSITKGFKNWGYYGHQVAAQLDIPVRRVCAEKLFDAVDHPVRWELNSTIISELGWNFPDD